MTCLCSTCLEAKQVELANISNLKHMEKLEHHRAHTKTCNHDKWYRKGIQMKRQTSV